MELLNLNPVNCGEGFQQWNNTVFGALRTHKNLAWLLRSDIKDYLEHLDRVKRPHKSHRARYEKAIERTRKDLRASKRAIQTIRRYGLLNMPKYLELPIIPYIEKATKRRVDAKEIDQEVEHGMAGFIAVNRRATQHFPSDLHKVMDFINSYGQRSNEENRKTVLDIKWRIFQTYFNMLDQIMDAAFLRDGKKETQEPNRNDKARLRVVG